MNVSDVLRTRRGWISIAGTVSLLGMILGLWLAPPADAQVGGYSEVTRLEAKYQPDQAILEARFHLASGIALTQRIEDGPGIDRLLSAAETFAQPRARMFVTAENDKITAWYLSIP
jgi:hypothetical protein